MRVSLAQHGRSFATRARARELLTARSETITEVDLGDLRAISPSFLDEFFGGLAEQASDVVLLNVSEEVYPRVERVISRRNLKGTLRLLAPA